MRSKAVRMWPIALLAANVVIAVASVVLSAGREAVFDTVFYAVNAVALGLCGFLIVSSRPGQRIGALLTTLGIQAGLVEVTEGYGYHETWAAAMTSTWVSQWASFVGIGAVAVLPAIFPDGRSVTPRWRPIVWIGIAGTVLSILGTAIGTAFQDRYAGGVNPYRVGGPVPQVLSTMGQFALLVALVGSVASLVVRYRRSGTELRVQLKWLLSVLGLFVVVGPLALFLYDDSVLVQWLIAVTVVLIPVAVCIAIVRHRLYDIDVIVSRTVGYAVLSGVLVGCWLLVAWLVGVLSASGTRPG